MQKFLVIVLILSLSNETFAWKNWNPKSFLKTRNTNENCLGENEISIGLSNYIMDTYKTPKNFTMDFLSNCERYHDDAITCYEIWTAFGLHVMKLIQDNDLQPLVDFEKQICHLIETMFDCSYCQTSVTNFPLHLTSTDFVQDFFSKILFNSPEDCLLWITSFTGFLEKHSEGMCSYACPTST